MYVTGETAMSVAAVYSCVSLISDVMASIPIDLFNVEEKDGDRELAKDNPLFNLLKYQPNPFQTAFEYWKFNLECLLLRGGYLSYVLKTSGGRPLQLLPIMPDAITRIQDREGNLYFSGTSMIGSNYSLTFDKEPAKNFLWSNYRTIDGVNPVSPITYAALQVGIIKAADLHGARTFKNGARPSGVVSVAGNISEPAADRMSKSWKQNYGGENTGSVAILEGGAKYERVSMSNEDAQYIQTCEFRRSEICGIYRVPPHMIGDTTKAKGWSTLEQQNQDLLNYTFNPYMQNIEQGINRSLIASKDWGAIVPEYDTNIFLKSDIAGRTAYYTAMYNVKAMNPNEIRHAEGLNSRDGGNEYAVVNAIASAVQKSAKPKKENEEIDENE